MRYVLIAALVGAGLFTALEMRAVEPQQTKLVMMPDGRGIEIPVTPEVK